MILFIISVLFIFELADIAVFGFYLKDKNSLSYIESILPNLELNTVDNDIMHDDSNLDSFNFIAKNYAISSKWYINGKGMIPRWTKMHKLLNKKHKELLSK